MTTILVKTQNKNENVCEEVICDFIHHWGEKQSVALKFQLTKTATKKKSIFFCLNPHGSFSMKRK